jgi:hypothetical protein
VWYWLFGGLKKLSDDSREATLVGSSRGGLILLDLSDGQFRITKLINAPADYIFTAFIRSSRIFDIVEAKRSE